MTHGRIGYPHRVTYRTSSRLSKRQGAVFESVLRSKGGQLNEQFLTSLRLIVVRLRRRLCLLALRSAVARNLM